MEVAQIIERAQEALIASPIFALRDLRVQSEGDSVLITGRVESFYQKQLAQELVRAVVDGTQVVNSIDVP